MTDVLDNGPFFHGTKVQLEAGYLLTAGFNSNYRPEVAVNHTTSPTRSFLEIAPGWELTPTIAEMAVRRLPRSEYSSPA